MSNMGGVEIVMSIHKLRQLIYQKYKSEAKMASALNWTRQHLNRITNGIKEPDIHEISELSKLLDIPVDEMIQFFLSN